jgi:hypothetical protein
VTNALNNTRAAPGMAGWCAHLVCGLQLQLLKDLLRLRLGGTHGELEGEGKRCPAVLKKEAETWGGMAKDERGRSWTGLDWTLCLGVICNLAVAPNACGVAIDYH